MKEHSGRSVAVSRRDQVTLTENVLTTHDLRLTTPATAAVVVAAGRGERLGAPDKVLLPLAGRPLLVHVLDTLETAASISEIVVVVGSHTQGGAATLIAAGGWTKPIALVTGGAQRHDSVRAGLAAVSPAAEYVAVHDGARPLAPADLFDRCRAAAVVHGAAIAAIPVPDTLQRVRDNLIETTVDRSGLWAAQTPQVFRRSLLLAAIAAPHDSEVTDEARLFEALGLPVAVVTGSSANLKITHPGDILLAEAMLAMQPPAPAVRIGIGYDAHVFAPGRRLILGGIEIPHDTGLLGHSDADVLLHAIADALLGAAALGDIGQHFPPTDSAFKDADSQELVRRVVRLVNAAGYAPLNVDATVIAEAPRLGPHVPAMRTAIASCLGLPDTAVSVKATTNEGMGAIGRGEGIAALATATITTTKLRSVGAPPASFATRDQGDT